MADDVTIRLGLTGQQQVSRGLKLVAQDEKEVGEQATRAGMKAQEMGARFIRSVDGMHLSMGRLGYQLPYVALGIAGVAAAGVKWGLSFNAQVETARIRFQNFTGGSAKGAQQLVDQVQKINVASRFNLSNLTNAAAVLGNMGVSVSDIPNVLRGIANAAAASGGGNDALDRMALAIGQIQSKGRLSQQELDQLTLAGAPYVNQTIAKGFNLTAKQVQNIGNNALNSKKAIQLLTQVWTSGALADATKRDLNSLAGQWSLFTDGAQEATGAITKGLAGGLEHDLLPAANRALTAITKIFGEQGISSHEKLAQARAVIVQELGPTWDLIKRDIDKAQIPQHFGAAVGAALPKLADAAAQAAPGAAKAFVDGWLHSGPWVQFLSAAYLAKKLGAVGAIGKALGRGGAAGSGGIMGKGNTPADPLWVAVVDKVPGAGVGAGSGGPEAAARRTALRVAEVTGKGGLVAGLAYGTYVGAKDYYGLVMPKHYTGPLPKSSADRAVDQQVLASREAASHMQYGPWASGYQAPPVQVQVQSTLQIGGQQVATSVTTANAKTKARTR